MQRLLLMFLVVFSIISPNAMANPKYGGNLTPIDLSKAGNSAVLEVHVGWISNSINKNPLELALQIIGPKDGRQGWMPQFDELIFSVTGTHYRSLTEQEIVHPAPHMAIRLHVVWRDKSSNVILKEGDVHSGHDWQGRIHAAPGPSLALDRIRLPPGDYEITVTTLSDDSRFDGTFTTGLCIGKTFN